MYAARNYLFYMAPRVGFEPTTCGLTVGWPASQSNTELFNFN